MKMRLIISASILIFTFGCTDRGRVDPYVPMINVYIDKLDNWDYSSAQEPPVPPTPAFASPKDLSGPIGPYNTKHYPMESFIRPDNKNVNPKMSESVLRINEINNAFDSI